MLDDGEACLSKGRGETCFFEVCRGTGGLETYVICVCFYMYAVSFVFSLSFLCASSQFKSPGTGCTWQSMVLVCGLYLFQSLKV